MFDREHSARHQALDALKERIRAERELLQRRLADQPAARRGTAPERRRFSRRLHKVFEVLES